MSSRPQGTSLAVCVGQALCVVTGLLAVLTVQKDRRREKVRQAPLGPRSPWSPPFLPSTVLALLFDVTRAGGW